MRDLPSTLASAVQAWKYAGKKEILDYSDRDVSVIVALESGAPTPVFVDGQRESYGSLCIRRNRRFCV